MLGDILKQIFPGQTRHQDSLDFLGKQRVDYSVRNSKLSFEYDGEQHFRPIDFSGKNPKQAEETFKLTQERDKRKNKLCRENGYTLIRIAYNEDLTLENVQNKIATSGGRNA